MNKTIRTVLALAAATHVLTVWAQPAAREYDFQIERERLRDVLSDFALQSGMNVLYSGSDSEQTVNLVIGPLQGRYTITSALDKLLANSELTYVRPNDRTIVLQEKKKNTGVKPIAMLNQDGQVNAAAVAAAPEAAGTAAAATGAARTVSTNASNRDDNVETVIVTAQRRDERLQDVPISITVLRGVELDRSSSRGVSDVLNQVGGVSLVESAPGNSQISVRGVVPDETVGTSTTGYYLDEVPFTFISSSQLPDANAFDLSRVEVLRGPQGTLYGANALSGVVRLITNEANLDDLEAKGRMRASQTDHGGNNYGGDFAVNVPLVSGKLAVRAVASYSDMSGYIDSSLTGDRGINDSQVQAYRLNANYKPIDELSVKFGWSRSKIENGAPSRAMDDLTTPFSTNQPDERIYDTYNLIGEYRLPTVTLLSSTSYLDYSADTQAEIMLAGAFRLNFFNSFGLRSFAQEFRAASHLQGPWQWSAGAIYKGTTETQVQNAQPLLPFPYQVREQSKSYAVFGELTRSFAEDKVAVTAGLRYFEDDLDSTQQSDFFGPGIAPRAATFDKVTGRLVLNYKPETNYTYYASIATGFRSGLSQTPAVAVVDPSFPPIDPDSLTNYEVGTKGTTGGTLGYEVAVYYTDWKDVQQSVIVPLGFVGRVNAGTASGLGVDASVSVQPIDALVLRANVGWSGLEFDEDVSSGGVVLFSKGARVNRSPEWTGALSGSYRIVTPMDGTDVVLGGSFNYRSEVSSRYLNGALLTQTESDAMRTLNMSVGLESERWSISLYGDNLLDERGSIAPPDLTFANSSVRLRPLTIGLQGTFNY
jgi:outer membrane receptor protein involved in Fe transport